MAGIDYIRFILLTTVVVDVYSLEIKPETLKEYEVICKNVSVNAFFDNSMVVRKVWRAYYTWNINLNEECSELSFKYPNDLIINRIWKDMHGYLMAQPQWAEAVLVMIVGKTREMLLFNDHDGGVGQFLAVPNIPLGQLTDTYKGKNQVPLIKFSMKLLHKGTYLVTSDCRFGITMLSVRLDKRPKRIQIETVAKNFSFGDGYPACINDPDPKQNEQ